MKAVLNNKVSNNNEQKITSVREYMVNYIEDFLLDAEKRSSQTARNYRSDIQKLAREMFGYDDYKFIKKQDFENLTVDDLIQYFNACWQEVDMDGVRKYSNATINRRISSLKSLLKYLVARDKIEFPINNMLVLLKTLPKTTVTIDVLSIEDADRCIEFFKTQHLGHIASLMAKLSVDTALRANELITLTWKQFYVEENGVTIKSVGDIKGKGNKDWRETISKELYEELLTLKQDGVPTVFNISYSYLAKLMNKTTKELGLNDKNYTFHSFRKRSITNELILTNDIRAAQKKARHSSIATTGLYLEETNYSMTGYYSLGEKLDKDLYKKVDNELLIKALESLGGGVIHNLNIKLSEILK